MGRMYEYDGETNDEDTVGKNRRQFAGAGMT